MKQAKPSTHTFANAWSDAEKLALAAGSLSLLSFGAQADIIYTANSVTIDFTHTTGIGSAITWSVDGSHSTFKLFNNNGNGSFFLVLSSAGSLLGRGLVRQDAQVSYNRRFVNLGLGFGVGPSLATGYNFGGRANDRSMLSWINAGTHNTVAIPLNAKNFTSGVDGYFGFKFTDAGLANAYYGWAELNLDTASPGTVTINRWAYESCTGQSIAAGATTGGATCGGSVPEPDTLSLTLLGLGAGGVRAWRKRKQALAA